MNNEEDSNVLNDNKESESEFMEEDDTKLKCDVTPLGKELITFTSLPFTKWKTLVNFDIVTVCTE
jgi:hypothetical protein